MYSESKTKSKKQRIAVIGAGLVGTNTAYFLSQSDNFDITVYDEAPKNATVTSAGNAGRFVPFVMKYGGTVGGRALKRVCLPTPLRETLSPVHADPNMPYMHAMQIKWTPDVIKFGLLKFYSTRYKDEAVRFKFIDFCSQATQALLKNMDHATITYSPFNLLIKPLQLKPQLHKAFFVNENNSCTQMSTKQCLHIYPWLAPILSRKDVQQIVFRVSDFTVDSKLFCNQVENFAKIRGVQFKYNNKISNIIINNGKATGVKLDNGQIIEADIVIACCAVWSQLFKEIKSNIFMLPCRGASVDLYNWRMTGDNREMVQVSDETSGDLNFQFCPLDSNRIRITGFADFVGLHTSDEEKVFLKNKLVDQLKYLLPDLRWESESPVWVGYRPMSPDNMPYIGPDRDVKNLYISCGHGSIGWTTSGGSGKLLADIITSDLGISVLSNDQKQMAHLLSPNRYNLF